MNTLCLKKDVEYFSTKWLIVLFTVSFKDNIVLEMNERCAAMVECYWYRKISILGEESVPMQHFPPQIPHGLLWDWTQASTVRGWWLTTWAMAPPIFSIYNVKTIFAQIYKWYCGIIFLSNTSIHNTVFLKLG